MSRPYSRSPGGLLLPVHLKVAGRVRWQVLDERGVPEVPRTPSGIPLGPVEGIEQPNLITNLGLNRMTDLRFHLINTGNTSTLRRRLAVGTGSTAPDVTDTTLDNEVQRADTSGSFSAGGPIDGGLDTGTDEIYLESLVTRIATMTADRNVTEFGFAQLTTDDILIRELLRDGGGTPITVSLLDGKTLRVDHMASTRVAAPAAGTSASINVEEYDAGNNLVNTIPYDVVHGPFLSADTINAARSFMHLIDPSTSINVFGTSAGSARSTTAQSYDRLDDPGNLPSPVKAISAITYVNDSFTRAKRAEFAVGDANDAHRRYFFSSFQPGSARAGWRIDFDDPATYTKQNTDTLRAGIVVTWARA